MTLQAYAADSELKQHRSRIQNLPMRELFAAEPERFEDFSIEGPELFLDYSKNRIDKPVMGALIKLAEQAGLHQAIQDMFAGKAINNTEGRPALHVALRGSADPELKLDGLNVNEEVRAVREKMLAFTDQIHQGTLKGYSGQPIDTLVSIGIGGSYLGPLMVNEALAPYKIGGLNTYFVANIDPGDLSQVLAQVDPETTLFLIQSKSFGTLETLENARAARQWLLQQGATEADIKSHFAAVSANVSAASEFGISAERVFPMWDWVGGRYSLWSAIGLPILFQFGREVFDALLDGAHAMDLHFLNEDFASNIPVVMALLGVWYINYFDAATHAVVPYDHYLKELPGYLQQLDMESNGKSVRRNGEPVEWRTGPVIWGGVGCNGQHAYHQLLHQGTELIPVDFIVSTEARHQIAEHHSHLFANCLAQSQAMMKGKSLDEATRELLDAGLSKAEALQLAPHKVIAGNKPSNTILLRKLTPKALGSLIALYEHKVFVQGILWDINSFDQWGVELGKTLETNIYPSLKARIDNKEVASTELDSSTSGLINKFAKS